MLKQRVATAEILLAVLLGALLAPSPWPLILLLVLAAVCGLWEWLRLTWPGSGSGWPLFLAVLSGAGILGLAAQWLAPSPAAWSLQVQAVANRQLLPVVALIWVVFATALVFQGQSQRRSGGLWLSLFGVAAILAVWLALVQMFVQRGAWF